MTNKSKRKKKKEPEDGLVTNPQEVQMRLMQMLLDMGKAQCEGYDLPDGTPDEQASTNEAAPSK